MLSQLVERHAPYGATPRFAERHSLSNHGSEVRRFTLAIWFSLQSASCYAHIMLTFQYHTTHHALLFQGSYQWVQLKFSIVSHHETAYQKTLFFHRKCAKTHLQQSRCQKNFRGSTPGPPWATSNAARDREGNV